MKSKIKRLFNIFLVSIITLLSLFSLTGCSSSYFCVTFVYKDLYGADLSDRSIGLSNYMLGVSLNILSTCALYFGPSNSHTTIGMDFRSVLGMEYNYNSEITRDIIANDLAMMTHVYYYSLGDADDNKVLILSNDDKNNKTTFLGYNSNNQLVLNSNMYKISGSQYTYLSKNTIIPYNTLLKHINGKKVSYFFVGKSVGTMTFNNASNAEESIRSLYSNNNAGVIQRDFRGVSILENSNQELRTKQWEYSKDVSWDSYETLYKENSSNSSGFLSGYVDLDVNIRDIKGLFTTQKNGYKLAMELVIAMRFEGGVVPHETIPSSLYSLLSVHEQYLDEMYATIMEEARNGYDDEIMYRDFVICACAPLDTIDFSDSNKKLFADVLYKKVIGYDDDNGRFARNYDLYTNAIINRAIDNTERYSPTFDIPSNISQMLAYNKLKRSDKLLASTCFIQSVVIYSHRSWKVTDVIIEEAGNSKLDGIYLELTLPAGSKEEDYELLSEYIVTCRYYRCKKNKDNDQLIVTNTSKEYALTRRGKHRFSVNIDDEYSKGVFVNQKTTYPQPITGVNLFGSGTGVVLPDYNNGQVRGYGSYYKGLGWDGEQFVELVFTSPYSDKSVNIVVDYISL